MATRPIKPHQQAILDDFDAGVRNVAELARRHGYSDSGVFWLLRRYGRATRSHQDAEARAEKGARMKALHADPEFKAKVSAATSARMKALNADPEFKAKIRAGLARRRAAKIMVAADLYGEPV